jgi:hypothetical protein
MQKYMLAQKKKIELEKWYEGCKMDHDPGESFIINWIFTNANQFREAWEQSLCKKCCLVEECGFEVRDVCNKFEK